MGKCWFPGALRSTRDASPLHKLNLAVQISSGESRSVLWKASSSEARARRELVFREQVRGS